MISVGDLEVLILSRCHDAEANGIFNTKITIPRENLFDLLMICHNFNIRCWPVTSGLIKIFIDLSKESNFSIENPENNNVSDDLEIFRYKTAVPNNFQDKYLDAILEWDEEEEEEIK